MHNGTSAYFVGRRRTFFSESDKGKPERSYTVFLAEDGKKAFPLFQNNTISLCVIDVMLPHVDGFTLARQIRAVDATVPVLFLTARIATQDVIEGYESGGNDYLKNLSVWKNFFSGFMNSSSEVVILVRIMQRRFVSVTIFLYRISKHSNIWMKKR